MKFIAMITHRVDGDRNGVGHKANSRAKTFDETTTIKEIWEWWEKDNARGVLEISKEV